MERRALGATLVTVLLFASLLTSNMVLVLSAEHEAERYSLADEARNLADTALLMRGTASLKLLALVQGVVSSNTYDCFNAPGELYDETRGMSYNMDDGSVHSSASLVGLIVNSSSHPDNMTVVKPFDGVRAGELGLLVATSVAFTTPGNDLAYQKSERHVLDLPFDLRAMMSLCVGIVGKIVGMLDSIPQKSCVLEGTAQSVSGVVNDSRNLASSRGYMATISLRYLPSACEVRFGIEMVQKEIQGPAGSFSLTVEANRTVRFPNDLS
jgi:hypothetical protein